MANELKPCPFCCGEAKVITVLWGHRFYEITCPNCKARVSRESKEEVIEAWNRRADNGE